MIIVLINQTYTHKRKKWFKWWENFAWLAEPSMPFERALKSCLEKSLPMLRECAQRLHDKYRHQTNRLAKLFSTARHSLLDSFFSRLLFWDRAYTIQNQTWLQLLCIFAADQRPTRNLTLFLGAFPYHIHISYVQLWLHYFAVFIPLLLLFVTVFLLFFFSDFDFFSFCCYCFCFNFHYPKLVWMSFFVFVDSLIIVRLNH